MCLHTRLHIHGRTHTLTPSSVLSHITRNSGNRRFLATMPFLQPQKEPQEAQAHPTSPLVHQSCLQMLHGRNMRAFPVASSVPPDSNVGGPSVEASDTGAQGRVHGCALGFGVGMSRLWRSAIHCLCTHPPSSRPWCCRQRSKTDICLCLAPVSGPYPPFPHLAIPRFLQTPP